MVQAAALGSFMEQESLKDMLEAANEAGCPL